VTDFDSGGTYAADNHSISDIHDDIWQEALDYDINAIKNVDLIVGGTYYHIHTKYTPDAANVFYVAPAGALPGTPISSYLKSTETFFYRTKEAWAGFIDATWHATDKLSINVGGRYSEETQDVNGKKNAYCTTLAGCAGGIPLGGLTATIYDNVTGNNIPDAINSSKYSKFTPRASIRYEIMPRTNVYASYSKGFRSGEWNSTIPGDNPANWKPLGQIGQESVDAFEVGVKSAGSRLNVEASGFYYNYHDLQVSATSFDANGVAVVSLQSIPKARVYGIEGSADYKVTDYFTVRAGATWLHARYGDGAVFIGTSVNTKGVGFNFNADPIKTLPNLVTQAQDLSGLQMSRAPDFTGYIGFDYYIRKGDGGFRFAANLKYTSSYVVTNPSVWGGEPLAAYQARVNAAKAAGQPIPLPNNSVDLAGSPYAGRASEERARQPAFALLNASVTWTDPTDHYYVRLWGNNLTNVLYRQHYNPTGYSPIAEPFTFGGTIGYKF
jgi:iron complex outermembrane receptor protein